MAWTIEYSESAKRDLKRLDRQAASRILDYMDSRIATAEDPRRLGKALTGPLGDRWRYRVGDYRVLCDIQDGKIHVLVLNIGHRGDVYRRR